MSMDNSKIGNFIAKLRKEKNITQKELGDKLFVSDRAISKWERGICMPDISLLIPLSKELDINVNDLLSGELVEKKEYHDIFEKNIITIVSKVDKDNKRFKKMAVILLIIIILFPFFKMCSNQFFYTSGISFSSFKIKSKANEFYKALQKGENEKIASTLTNYHQQDQWKTEQTNYSKKLFLENIGKLKSLNVEYKSFKPIKYYWNGTYGIDYEMCFQNRKEHACIYLSFILNTTDNKLMFGASSLDYPFNNLQKIVMDVFYPIWNWKESTFDNFVLPFN